SLLHRELGYLAAEQGVVIPDQRPVAVPDLGSPSGITPPVDLPGATPPKTPHTTQPKGPPLPGPLAVPGSGPGEEAAAADVRRGTWRRLDKSLIARTLGEVREAKAKGDLARAGQLLEQARQANELYQPQLA